MEIPLLLKQYCEPSVTIQSLLQNPKTISIKKDALPVTLDKFSKIVSDNQCLKYILSELLDNIDQHSKSKAAYLQYIQDNVSVTILIYDNGLTIPKSLHEDDDSVGIAHAIGGKSSKPEGRGHGLSSSVRIITKGLLGSILVISSQGAYNSAKTGENIFKLPAYRAKRNRNNYTNSKTH